MSHLSVTLPLSWLSVRLRYACELRDVNIAQHLANIFCFFIFESQITPLQDAAGGECSLIIPPFPPPADITQLTRQCGN